MPRTMTGTSFFSAVPTVTGIAGAATRCPRLVAVHLVDDDIAGDDQADQQSGRPKLG